MSIFDGVELSEEVKEQLQANLNKHQEGFVERDEFNRLKGNRDELLTEKKTAQAAKEEAEELAKEEARKSAAKNGDIDSLNASWQDKVDKVTAELNDLKDQGKKNSVNSIARGFVNENVVDDVLVRDAMTKEIAGRLDMREGKPVVLDAEGNLTALTVDDLLNEVKAAGKYKPHLVATKASGGGAGGSDANSAGGAPKTLATAESKEERIAAIKARREARNG